MSEAVFLDASFWIAYRDERESSHAAARGILTDLFRARARFTTTFHVICEIHAYFSRHSGKRRLVIEDLWGNPLLHIEEVTHKDQGKAIELLRQRADKSFSLCDASSFVVMQRLGLRRVVTFDDHFQQFGEFEIVR